MRKLVMQRKLQFTKVIVKVADCNTEEVKETEVTLRTVPAKESVLQKRIEELLPDGLIFLKIISKEKCCRYFKMDEEYFIAHAVEMSEEEYKKQTFNENNEEE